jgi:hypothetical protein
MKKLNNKYFSGSGKYVLGPLVGAGAGGVIGNKAGEFWSKTEKEELKSLTSQFMSKLKRQPRLYSLYIQINQMIKSFTVMDEGLEKKETKKTALKLTGNFLKGLTKEDKLLYLKIQKLTDNVYSIQNNSIKIGITLGGIIGLVIADKIK